MNELHLFAGAGKATDKFRQWLHSHGKYLQKINFDPKRALPLEWK